MGKLETAKKVVQTVGNASTGTVEKTVKDSNNLLLLFLIVIVWFYLFFSKGDGK